MSFTTEQIMEKFTMKRPHADHEGEFTVWLKVDHQSFQLRHYHDAEEADWLRRQLALSLGRFIEQFTISRLELDPPAVAEIPQPSDQASPPSLTGTDAPDMKPEAALPVPPVTEASNPSVPPQGLNAQTNPQ